ncbi:hypothetical protein COB21_00530 [Candidatus Aerophobetes bacterium]|uniref:Uncharacterized protein n=1 Tax=Aerophobetes bacterium TaxID=2030807 RepID=A0A2A4X8R7_UNCAE|nr:MAG: hypothetical protein COB21_00530 [Candidatus Aerophobetes bacterium]
MSKKKLVSIFLTCLFCSSLVSAMNDDYVFNNEERASQTNIPVKKYFEKDFNIIGLSKKYSKNDMIGYTTVQSQSQPRVNYFLRNFRKLFRK